MRHSKGFKVIYELNDVYPTIRPAIIEESGGRKISRVFRRNSASFEFYGLYRNKKLVQLEKSNNNCLQFRKQLIIDRFRFGFQYLYRYLKPVFH